MGPGNKLVELISGKRFRKGWTALNIAFFLLFVIIPTVYILSYAITDWSEIQEHVLSDPATMDLIIGSIIVAFEIATIVTIIDFVAGLPLAWMMARKDFRGKQFLDTLIDMPLAVPTAALGFSAAIFWAVTPNPPPFSLATISSPMILIILLHVVFSYPYMVRSLTAILGGIDETYETAGRTLGASRLTAVRTITLPLFRAGLVTGAILCFARSLSETGGTIIALATLYGRRMVEGDFHTGPSLIGFWKDASVSDPTLIPALSFVSILLIILALVLLLVLKIVIMRVRLPLRKVWPSPEKLLSRGLFPKIKDTSAIIFLIVIVLIPSFFIFTYVLTANPVQADWSPFIDALLTSFLVATIVTLIDLVMGIPMALYIVKNKTGRLSQMLDVLVNVPLIVPTAALGFSLGLFWSNFDPNASFPLLLIILAHVAFTYPLVVRNVVGAVEGIDPAFEETARTLGAKPIQSFRRVLFPMIKGSILAGAIMAFTRSLGETGATLAVVANANTAPVYIVELVNEQSYYLAAMACIILIIISYVFMLLLRRFTREEVV
ncbi:MAG: iron ABC transporter permease [Euryarchaeota archaeon]|nr:iron ABC transporter permease [Euryarchaeota archaeon]